MRLAVVVMAAGIGTRMKSELPKVLHPIGGKPLLRYSLDAVKPLDPVRISVIVGHEADLVKTKITESHGNLESQSIIFIEQSPQLGTGHAVQQAEPVLSGQVDAVLVIPGDLPLLTTDTFRQIIRTYQKEASPLVILTTKVDDPRGFGRIIRDSQGYVSAIVEEVDCTPEQKAIRELNVGAYMFKASWLWDNLPKVPLSPKGEYYITDLVDIAVTQDLPVVAETLHDATEAIGVNNRVHLAEAEAMVRRRINRRWMEAGVTMIDPSTTYIGAEVTLQPDTIIYPNTYLYGKTSIGRECVIGPGSYIIDSNIGNNCVIRFSMVEQATLEDNVDVGPYSHLRSKAHLANGVHMGNFGEVKNSYLGPGTKMGHFSYLGDAKTGTNVNIGAGTITCNYDGVKKHPTNIGDNVFIGSDTMLVAPVNIGENSKTGAGAVVTNDIPDNALAYGVPARVKKSDTKQS